MIDLTKLNGEEIIVNIDLIETIEATPDTVLTLINGKKMVVLESPDEIVLKAIAFKKSIFEKYIF
ncbi:MAG: flagellar FlbD family protein [Clostridia bacterium]|nr:flagellar FlbD family protein [Clostridia bacterium]MDD4047622.1 flagellar FlbD family protein [Clostridia bacterium]